MITHLVRRGEGRRQGISVFRVSVGRWSWGEGYSWSGARLPYLARKAGAGANSLCSRPHTGLPEIQTKQQSVEESTQTPSSRLGGKGTGCPEDCVKLGPLARGIRNCCKIIQDLEPGLLAKAYDASTWGG